MYFCNYMKKTDSPYYRGAVAGIFFGIYLSAIFLSMALSSRYPILSCFTIGLIVFIPLYIYKSLRRTYVKYESLPTFPELWMQGIATFVFACSICGLVTMVYMTWVAPGFLVEQVRQYIELCEQTGTPEQLEMARILNNMIRQGVVPSPSTFVISMFWVTVAGGCFISLVMAVFARFPRMSRKRVNDVN